MSQEAQQEDNLQDRTVAVPEKKHFVSRDQEPEDELEEEVTKIQAQPDDPRMEIAKKFSEKHRTNLEHPEEDEEEEEDLPDEIEVKILGETRMVAREKVEEAGGITAYQKEAAAAEKLRIASENTKIIEERAALLRKKEEDLAAREARLSQQDAGQSPQGQGQQGQNARHDPPSGDQKQALMGKAKAYHEALLEGDEDASEAALLELLDMGRGNNAIPEKEVERIRQQTVQDTLQIIERQRYQNELKSAVVKFKQDYSDLVSDPRLYAMTDQETAKLKREHPDWDIGRIFEEAGNNIRAWYGEKKGDADEDELARLKKEAEKRSLRQPGAGTGRNKSVPKESPRQTDADYVRQARKARGQAV